MFSIDYMYMTSKPTKGEVAHPILVIKARRMAALAGMSDITPKFSNGSMIENQIVLVRLDFFFCSFTFYH